MALGPPLSDGASSPEQAPIGEPVPNGGIPGSNREGGIEQLSRLMLEGWTMLADTCPRNNCHMPLARSREGRLFCCACQSDVVREGDRPATSSASPMPTSPTAAPANNSVVAVRNTPTHGPPVRREAVSAELGEKLLQGWTMLEQSCTNCATPLLRSSAGTVLCVQCAGAGATAPRNVGGNPGGSGTLPAPPQRAQLPPATQTTAERAMEGGSTRTRALMPPPAAAPQVPTDTAMHVNDGGTFEELCRAEEAVVRTLRTLRESLPRRRDLDGIRSVLEAIREAADTIEVLRKTRGCVL